MINQITKNNFFTVILPLAAAFVLLFLAVCPPAFAQLPAEDDKDKITINGLVAAVSAGSSAFADTRAKLVRMLYDVNNGHLSREEFYKKASTLKGLPAGQELRHTLIQIKTDIGNYRGGKGLEMLFGKQFSSGGSEVEAKLLSYRKEVTMEMINEAIRRFAGTPEASKFTFYYGEVGGWPNERPGDMTFAGDIDFNFLSGDLDAAWKLKGIFDEIVKSRFNRLTAEALDIPCTVHGQATTEVYIGRHGQSFAEKVTKVLWRIIFDPAEGGGPRIARRDQPTPFQEARQRMILEANINKANNALPDLGNVKKGQWPNQPGVSLEMIRHFEHDIAGKKVYTDLQSFVKAAKYAERGFDFLKEAFAKDGKDVIRDKVLYELTQNLTIHKKSPKKQIELITKYFQDIGQPLPYNVNFAINDQGKEIAVIKANEAVIEEFWDICRKSMWEGANMTIRKLISDFTPRINALSETDGAGAKAIYDDLIKYHEMLEIENLILHDETAGVHGHLDKEYVQNVHEFREMAKGFKQKIAKNKLLKYIDPQMDKAYKWVEEMLKAEGGEDEFHAKLAAAAIMAVLKTPEHINDFLDYLDNTMMNKLRHGGGLGDNYEDILSRSHMYYWTERADQFLKGTEYEGFLTKKYTDMEVSFDKQLQQLDRWFDRQMENKLSARGIKLIEGGAGAIQTVNNAFNASVANSTAGQVTMKAMMLYNLAEELPAYVDLLYKDDWGALGAEFFKRRVPFGGAVERGFMGDYYGVAWEMTSTLVPPAGFMRVAWNLGEYLGQLGYETYFDQELEFFIDNMYDGARFKATSVEEVGPNLKVSKWELLSVTYNSKKYPYKELIDLEMHDAREMATCIKKPTTDERETCFPTEYMRNGIFEWIPEADAFAHKFRKTDPFLQLILEMEHDPHAGQKLKEFYHYQKWTRLEQIKVEFLKHTKEVLEKRRSADEALLNGKIPDMYDQLMKIADDLDARPQINAALNKKFGGNIWQYLTELKDYLRGKIRAIYSDVDIWDIREELAAWITDNLSVYAKVIKDRAAAEKYLTLTLSPDDQGLRLLTGPYFLTGYSEEDAQKSRKWIEMPAQIKNSVKDQLVGIKREIGIEPPDLDSKDPENSYDLDTLDFLVWYETFKEAWKQVNGSALNRDVPWDGALGAYSYLKPGNEIPSYLGNSPSLQSKPNGKGTISDQERAQQNFASRTKKIDETINTFSEYYKNLKRKQELTKALNELQLLSASAQDLESKTSHASSTAQALAKGVEKDLNGLKDEMKKLSSEVGGLDKNLKQQAPNIRAIHSEIQLIEDKNRELYNLRGKMDNDKLTTCDMERYLRETNTTDFNQLDDLLKKGTNGFDDVNKDYKAFEKIKAEIEAAKKRVDIERNKAGRAEGTLQRYDPTVANTQERFNALRAKIAEIEVMITEIKAHEAKVNDIVSTALSIVNSVSPRTDEKFSKENQKIWADIQNVFDRIRKAQDTIIKASADTGTKATALSGPLASTEADFKGVDADLDQLKIDFTGDFAQQEFKTALSNFDYGVNAVNQYMDPIVKVKEAALTCRNSLQTQYDKKTSPTLLVEQKDCSQWPGKVAQWNRSTRQADCECPQGTAWDDSQRSCVLRQEPLNCSQYPGMQPVLKNGILICDCVSPTIWNQMESRCVIPQGTQPQDLNCNAYYPGTFQVWNGANNRYECSCPSGTWWDQNQRRCLTLQEVQAPGCAQWPGTALRWHPEDQSNHCDCPGNGYWSDQQKQCIGYDAGQQQQLPPAITGNNSGQAGSGTTQQQAGQQGNQGTGTGGFGVFGPGSNQGGASGGSSTQGGTAQGGSTQGSTSGGTTSTQGTGQKTGGSTQGGSSSGTIDDCPEGVGLLGQCSGSTVRPKK